LFSSFGQSGVAPTLLSARLREADDGDVERVNEWRRGRNNREGHISQTLDSTADETAKVPCFGRAECNDLEQLRKLVERQARLIVKTDFQPRRTGTASAAVFDSDLTSRPRGCREADVVTALL